MFRVMRAALKGCMTVVAAGVALATMSFAPHAQSPVGRQLTFTKDVAPIVQKSCQGCHRPGSIGPFSLLTWEDARPWARSIKDRVSRRQMPPWHVDKAVGIRKFKDDPSLTDAEIQTIVDWVDAGAPKGNPADLPAARVFD